MESAFNLKSDEIFNENNKSSRSDKESNEKKFPTLKPLDEDIAKNCKHEWFYGGGICKCGKCGWYLHPDLSEESEGIVTRTPTGRKGIKFYKESDIYESADVSPETGSGKLTPTNAERTLLTLTTSIINNNCKVTNYTLNTIANIITSNLLSEWTKGYTKLNIKFLPETSKLDFEFVPPNLSSKKNFNNEFIERFINGKESLSDFLHKTPEINIKISKELFKSFKSQKDLVTCFKNAIKYYDHGIDKGANMLAMQLMRFDTPTRELLVGPLNGVIIYALSLLFVFQDIDKNSDKTFHSDIVLIKTINKFIMDITKTYERPEKNKKQIINDLKKLVTELTKNTTYTETVQSLQNLSQIVESFYNSAFDDIIEQATDRFEYEQCECYIQDNIVFNEKVKIKRLKKIPADLVAYITIEGEAIKDANDKMMIISYGFSKLEIIDWYLELLEVGTKNYIVPHNKEYLENIRTQLLAAIKKIMDTPAPKSDRPIIDIKYPTNYEG